MLLSHPDCWTPSLKSFAANFNRNGNYRNLGCIVPQATSLMLVLEGRITFTHTVPDSLVLKPLVLNSQSLPEAACSSFC